ncbi:hypothetical protein MTZ49_07785 [Entomomonas sp. E2T0]|uniref:FimV/HubP family polar landmark protein n=1 Tax=Entomomonas sp. E2T0 TaxID=2930213 RepID=UPI0022284C51|nr:FimV/HubP family polar landmark protein [Entomomonas sp. E2T0]UYZ85439.1 hypothetical protein MTZ49_07785 [Entomomonas sp. E2T0]
MVKVHKLVAAIATTITLSTTSAYALNMGEISWKSSYGQPLNARIELSDAAGLRAADIKPSLASPDDFAKSGLDRTSELSNLTFKTVLSANGKGYIQISSTKPVKEPYLNFLLDVNWQGNKISREYTILMDLPASGNTNTAATKPVASQVSTPKPVSQSTIAGETYLTVRGDTLWSVAEKLSDNNSSAAKTATAIYKKNPKAFINGSANHLLAGYTLKVPTSKEINAISVAEATTLLQSTKSATAAAATPAKTDVTPTKPAVVDNKQTEQLQSQLENSKQALDNARQENDDLSTQLEQLQAEINRLEELSKQKDSQIEEAKTKLEQPATKPVVIDEPTADEKAAEEVAAQKAAQEEVTKKAAEEAAAKKAAQEEAAKKAAEEAAAKKAAQEEAAKKAAEEAAAKKAAQQSKPIAPVKQQDTTPEPSFISSLLGNQLLLMAGGGVLLIICIVALLLRRKKAANDDATVVDLSNVTLDDDDLNDPEQTDTAAVSSNGSQPSTSPLSQLGEGMGIIDKADIYLAYNHYDEAKDLLINALQDDPTNTEYRLKLMEVYAEQGDVGNFETEEQELILLDPLAQHKIDSLKEKYPTLASAQFNFSSPATVTPTAFEESPQFTSFETPEENTFGTSTSEEVSDLKEPEATEVSFDFDTLSTPTTQEIAEPEVEKEVIYEPDPTREVDESFELEKITPDSTELEKPIFGTNLDEDESFSSDSAIFDFEKEEAPQEEPKEEEFKFDLGFNSASEPPLEITDTHTPHATSEETADEMDDIIEKDQVTTKLELVHAYIDMGDTEGAHDLLEEIIREGNDSQQAEAKSLLASIGGDNQSSTTDDFTATIEPPVLQENEVIKDEDPAISLIDSTVDTKTSLAELDLGFELPPEDEVSTKLELANAYIEMGDTSGAKDILEEVLKEGTAEQIQQAEQILATLK